MMKSKNLATPLPASISSFVDSNRTAISDVLCLQRQLPLFLDFSKDSDIPMKEVLVSSSFQHSVVKIADSLLFCFLLLPSFFSLIFSF